MNETAIRKEGNALLFGLRLMTEEEQKIAFAMLEGCGSRKIWMHNGSGPREEHKPPAADWAAEPPPTTHLENQEDRQKGGRPLNGQPRTAPIDPTRIPQHTKLQVGAIFLRAFMRDYETPEFQAYFQRWKQEQAAQATRGRADG